MASQSGELNTLMPHHLNLTVDRVGPRHLSICVHLLEEFTDDQELVQTFKMVGPGRLLIFGLVRAECWTDEKFTEKTPPLSRPFKKNFGVNTVLDRTWLARLETEVRRYLCDSVK